MEEKQEAIGVNVKIRKYVQRVKDVSGFFTYSDPEGKHHRGKTLWDWLELLIIPLALAIGVLYFGNLQSAREQERLEDTQREETLQSYLDDMERLLLDNKLEQAYDGTEKSLANPLISVAQIKSVTVVRRLDEERRDTIFQFLRDSGLWPFIFLRANMPGADLSGNNMEDFYLSNADLWKADLSGAILWDADMTRTNLEKANLHGADLSGANLREAFLIRADLSEADLWGADLTDALLWNANLTDAILFEANLSKAELRETNLLGAILVEAHLNGAELNGTDLSWADLSGADLSGADLSSVKLNGAKYDKDTKWPDGWDKERLDAAGAVFKD